MSDIVVQDIKSRGIEAFSYIDSDSLPQSTAEIREIAKQAANAICQHFEKLTDLQEEMQDLSSEAKNAKSDLKNRFSLGLLGESKNDKRMNLLTEKSILQDEHNIEMAKLLQTSISLSLLSAKLSSAMISEMQMCVKKGFEDNDGRIKRLSQNSEQQARLLIQNLKQTKGKASKMGWIIAVVVFVAVGLGAFIAVKFAM